MTATALKGPRLQAAGYRRGRSFREAKSVRWLVAHSAEGAHDELDLGRYFGRTRAGSSHAGIGQDGGYASYVNYADTAWTNPPLNEEAETVELCGFARWSDQQWRAHPAMLETLARWLAWRATVRRIPLRLLTPADLRAGESGVLDHRRVNDVYDQSSHWDVGSGLPWPAVMKRAKQIAAVPPPKKALPVVDLSALTKAFHLDPERRQGGVTPGASDDVRLVEQALVAERLLPRRYAGDGSAGSLTTVGYRGWQLECGFRGSDADGMPGLASLTRLGRRHGFRVQL